MEYMIKSFLVEVPALISTVLEIPNNEISGGNGVANEPTCNGGGDWSYDYGTAGDGSGDIFADLIVGQVSFNTTAMNPCLEICYNGQFPCSSLCLGKHNLFFLLRGKASLFSP